MISSTVAQAFENFVPAENIHLNEPMSAHTTFRVGGPADAFIEIGNAEQLSKICGYLNKLEEPFFVMGNGSNLLVSDRGYRGVILQIAGKMNSVTVEGNVITSDAGAFMGAVARAAYENGLTGLEFASGIPGTIGGGVSMNAGAYDGELKNVVRVVYGLNSDGEEIEIPAGEMKFGYRTSVIRGRKIVVTRVICELQPGDKEQIKAKMDDFNSRRREKQPLEFPSAGSTFKRPEGYFAGKLIQDAGLRGYSVGGAQVSEKHCGFVINKGGATAADIYRLIRHIQAEVKKNSNVDLETEVIMLGDFE